MKHKLFLSALFSFRNIMLLLLAQGVAYGLQGNGLIPSSNIAYIAAAVFYLAMVMQSLTSKSYQDNFLKKQKIRDIQNLNYTCLKLAGEAKKHANSAYLQKLRKVMEDKNDIVNSFFRGDKGYLKQKIVEHTLNLVVSYLKLFTNFCMRSKELSEIDVGDITNRINMNTRRLNFASDPGTSEDLRKVVEMDQKIIDRLKDEKKELERISAKLDYMESTVNMFKHQLISNIETEDMVETLETAINEAEALDSVLEQRRRDKLRY